MKNISFQTFLFFFAVILYFPILYYGMNNVSSSFTGELTGGYVNDIGAALNFIAILALMSIRYTADRSQSFVKLVCLIWILIMLFDALLYSEDMVRILKDFNYGTLWVFQFLFFYEFTKTGHIVDKRIVPLFTILSFLSIFFSYRFFLNKISYFGEIDLTGSNYAYFVVCLLPWLLLMQKKKLRLLFIIIAGITILMSLKRTAIVALVIQILVIILFRESKKGFFPRLVTTLVLGGMLYLIVYYVDNRLSGSILTRFERAETLDEYGSRPAIWAVVINYYNNSPLFYKLFGHGLGSVLKDCHMGLSAHSDFVETLYDHGLFGLALFISFIIAMFRNAINVYKRNKDLGIAFLTSLVALLVLSISSHLITIFPCQIVFLSAIWGYILGVYERDLHINNNYSLTSVS